MKDIVLSSIIGELERAVFTMLEKKVLLKYMDLSINAVHSQYWKVGMVSNHSIFMSSHFKCKTP